MLAIAMTLVSLGPDPGKVCPVPCGRENIAATSFAKSFAEGSALGGEVQAVRAEGKMPKDVAGDVRVASAETAPASGVFTVIEANGAVSAGTIVQDEPAVAKDLSMIKTKVVVPVLNGKGKATGVEAHPKSGRSNEIGIAGIPPKVSESPPVSGTVDANKAISRDEPTTPQPDIAAPKMRTNPDPGEKPLIRNQGNISIAEKSLEEMPTDKVAKDHNVAVKAGKSEKIDKTDKAAGPPQKVGGVGSEAISVIPIVVFPPNGPTPGTSATPDENGIASVASTELKPPIGMAAVADNNAGKKHASTDKPNGEIKGQGFSLPDGPASQKPGTDEEKNTSSAAATTAGKDLKELSAVPINPATAAKHVDAVASIAASAPGAGVAAVSAAGVGAQPLVNSHVAVHSDAGMHSGASVIDAGTPTDATHRTLSATPTSLEIGVANGSHGWLKIRAEMGDGGVVNASLSTASSSGQESLHRELPSLAAYLQNEHVAVNTVVVQPVAVAPADPRGLGDGVSGHGGGQPQQSGGQGGDNRQDAANLAMNRMGNNAPYNRLSGMGDSEQLPLMWYARGGKWLSVRA